MLRGRYARELRFKKDNEKVPPFYCRKKKDQKHLHDLIYAELSDFVGVVGSLTPRQSVNTGYASPNGTVGFITSRGWWECLLLRRGVVFETTISSKNSGIYMFFCSSRVLITIVLRNNSSWNIYVFVLTSPSLLAQPYVFSSWRQSHLALLETYLW